MPAISASTSSSSAPSPQVTSISTPVAQMRSLLMHASSINAVSNLFDVSSRECGDIANYHLEYLNFLWPLALTSLGRLRDHSRRITQFVITETPTIFNLQISIRINDSTISFCRYRTRIQRFEQFSIFFNLIKMPFFSISPLRRKKS